MSDDVLVKARETLQSLKDKGVTRDRWQASPFEVRFAVDRLLLDEAPLKLIRKGLSLLARPTGEWAVEGLETRIERLVYAIRPDASVIHGTRERRFFVKVNGAVALEIPETDIRSDNDKEVGDALRAKL
jgi:hypothetical protein